MWAGKIRNVEIGKGNLFCTTSCIQSYGDSVFRKYYSQCKSSKDNINEFVKALADNYGDLNALHPFREGNGRTQREFARLVCLECGYNFDLSTTTHMEMLKASIASFDTADNSLLYNIFLNAVSSNDGMTQTDKENNIFIAKRLLVDNIYKSANLEGIAATYAQTVDIINNVAGVKLTPTEIGKICGLRDAWHYLLDNIDAPVDLAFLENLHEIVARAELPYFKLGKVRTEPVLISGTDWRPGIPDIERLHFELHEIISIQNATDRALTADLWVCRNQIFVDGNKRIGNFLANKILIANGNGIVNIPVELDGVFKTKLVAYYESGDMSELKQ